MDTTKRCLRFTVFLCFGVDFVRFASILLTEILLDRYWGFIFVTIAFLAGIYIVIIIISNTVNSNFSFLFLTRIITVRFLVMLIFTDGDFECSTMYFDIIVVFVLTHGAGLFINQQMLLSHFLHFLVHQMDFLLKFFMDLVEFPKQTKHCIFDHHLIELMFQLFVGVD